MEPSIYQNKTVMKTFILVASLIGAIQAFVWTILSIMAIVTYNIKNRNSTADMSVTYSNLIYQFFLVKGQDAQDLLMVSLKMNSQIFIIFMYLYLLTSIIWLVLSIISLLRLKSYALNNNTTRISTTLWSTITIIISIIDLVLMSIFVSDYMNIDKFSDSTREAQIKPIFQGMKTIVLTVYGIMMTVAARGYVLWVVNVTFAIILAIFSFSNRQNQEPRRSLINAYGASPRAFNLYEETNIGDDNAQDNGSGRINSGFVEDNNDPFRAFRLPYQKPQQNALNNDFRHFKFNTTTTPTAPTHFVHNNNNNERLAKIGRPNNNNGRRTPPQHVESPNVPAFQREPHTTPYQHGFGHNPTQFNLPTHQTVPQTYTNPNMPHIPEPDYDYNTPPQSPNNQHKSVLKSRSNYRY